MHNNESVLNFLCLLGMKFTWHLLYSVIIWHIFLNNRLVMIYEDLAESVCVICVVCTFSVEALLGNVM